MARRNTTTTEAVSGVATVTLVPREYGLQFTVNPAVDSNDASTATGTATVKFKSQDSDHFEDVYDAAGDALSFTLSGGVKTFKLDGMYERLRVTSSVSADEFSVSVR